MHTEAKSHDVSVVVSLFVWIKTEQTEFPMEFLLQDCCKNTQKCLVPFIKKEDIVQIWGTRNA